MQTGTTHAAVAAALVLLLVPSVISAQSGAPAVPYELHIVCPQASTGQFSGNSIAVECPIKGIDTSQMLGSPSIAVDPFEPNNVIVQMLHGAAAQNGPTIRSRDVLDFTTFVSTDAGATWFDNFYSRPIEDALGEHPHVSVDAFGHVYVGSLYSVPQGGRFRYTIGAQKFQDVNEVISEQTASDGSFNVEFIDPVFERSTIPQFWFVHDYATSVTTLVWNERLATSARSRAPNGVDLAALQAPELPSARSVIGMAWTTPGVSEPWHYVDESNLVGPCRTTTNPVLADGQIYIGCMIDVKEGGYKWDADPKEGQIDVFRFQLETGEPEYLGTSPVKGGSPKLGVRSDGRVVLMTTAGSKEAGTLLAGSYGTVNSKRHDIAWSRVREYGSDMPQPLPGREIVETNIQEMVYREQSGVVHMILKQRFELTDTAAGVSSPETRYAKYFVAIDEAHGFLRAINLDIGNLHNRSVFPGTHDPHEPFDDLADGIVQILPGLFSFKGRELGDTYQREFIAVGDYGIMNFAEVVEITELRAPGIAGVGAPQPPIPTPSLDISLVLTGTAGTALAGLTALALLLNRHRNPAAATARQGK